MFADETVLTFNLANLYLGFWAMPGFAWGEGTFWTRQGGRGIIFVLLGGSFRIIGDQFQPEKLISAEKWISEKLLLS